MRRTLLALFLVACAVSAASGARASIVIQMFGNTAIGVTPTPTATPTPTPGPTLPPFGMYNSHEPDTDLSGLEAQDAAMASDNISYEINYLSMDTTLTQLTSLLTYDAALSPAMTQLFSIKAILGDGTNIATGTSLVGAFDSSLANACGVTQDGPLLSCIYSHLSSYSNWGWYIYDEPGCPNQSIGYCASSLAGGNYESVQAVETYIRSTVGDTTHLILGINTPGGVPSGGWSLSNSNAITEEDNLYSCNGQSPCSTWSSPYTSNWITSSYTPQTGFDYYPWCYSTTGVQASICSGNLGSDVGYIAQLINGTIASVYSSEKISAAGQAFSWYQESGGGCTSYSLCLYPTQAEEQYQRDEALYYANLSGNPIQIFFWYYWPDVTCQNTYSGPLPEPTPIYSTSGSCSASANQAMLAAVNTAAFPTGAPVAPPTP